MSETNAAFDGVYFALEGTAAVVWIVALLMLVAAKPGVAMLRGAVAVQLALCVALPAIWLVGFPVRNGIEGAGRVLFGAPASIVTGLLGVAWLSLAGRKAGQGAWRSAWPGVAAVGACVLGWAVFLFS